eukprot:Skav234659  [mRNA]  locus=scaffold1131:231389:232990:- [translate_table: standard]
MPTVHTLQHMTQHESDERFHFFMALFFVIFFTTIIVGTVIMTAGPRMKACVGSSYHPLSSSRSGRVEPPSEEGDAAVGLDVESQRVLLAMAFAATLISCTITGSWSLQTDTLHKDSGLDWEMYALLLAGGGCGVVIQAIFAVKWLPKGQSFGISAFAEGAFVSLAPFMSDAFDTLKDTIFCFLCFQSQFLVLKVIGAVSWLYLVAIHIYFIRRDDTLAELAGCYLPVLGALPKFEETPAPADNYCCESGRNAVLLLLYKQTTPTKRKLLVIENLPQAVFSIIFLNLEGGSLFVAVINLGIPVAQIIATFVLFRPLLNLVGPQLGNKLSAFLEKPDFLKAKHLWDEAFRRDHNLLRKALPKLREVQLVKELLKELKPRKVRQGCIPCSFFQGARPQDAVEDAELNPNTDDGLETFGRGLEAAIELQGDLANVSDAAAAKKWKDSTFGTPGICGAALRGDVAAVRGFIRLDAREVQRADRWGDTPLHYAADGGRAEVVQVLLEAKASVAEKKGETPLQKAKRRERQEVVEFLRSA